MIWTSRLRSGFAMVCRRGRWVWIQSCGSRLRPGGQMRAEGWSCGDGLGASLETIETIPKNCFLRKFHCTGPPTAGYTTSSCARSTPELCRHDPTVRCEVHASVHYCAVFTYGKQKMGTYFFWNHYKNRFDRYFMIFQYFQLLQYIDIWYWNHYSSMELCCQFPTLHSKLGAEMGPQVSLGDLPRSHH